MELNKIYHGDCQKLIKEIPDNSVNCICIDPPYLYLKNQKLDREFDADFLFMEYKRILKPTGFVVMFGRGTSFYRWNCLLEDLGFLFKEEIVWNKRRISSPTSVLGRVHETVSIHAKGDATINKVMLNYGEARAFDLEKITEQLQRLGTVFDKGEQFRKITNNLLRKQKEGTYTDGIVEDVNKVTKTSPHVRRHVNTYVVDSMLNGVREQSIIEENRVHIGQIHPTQKPVRLIERLLALVRPKNVDNPVVLDTFAGSCTTAIAAINSGWKYICMEIDDEYFNKGAERVDKYRQQGVQHSLF